METSGPPQTELMTKQLGNQVSQIYVGKKRKQFTVHTELLLAASDYFKAYRNKHFKEGSQEDMYLDEDPKAFALFVHKLYRGSLPALQHDADYLGVLIEYFVLIDKLLMPGQHKEEAFEHLLNYCVRATNRIRIAIKADLVAKSLEKLSEDCPVRYLIFDLVIYLYITHFKYGLMGNSDDFLHTWLERCLRPLSRKEMLEAISERLHMFDPFGMDSDPMPWQWLTLDTRKNSEEKFFKRYIFGWLEGREEWHQSTTEG